VLNIIPLFSNLTAAQLQSMGAHAAMRVYEKGEVIVQQGEVAQSLHVLVAGQVKVYMSNEENREVIINTLSAGEFFGELPMFDQEPRSASVAAIERCHVQTLSYTKFQKLLDGSPDIARRIMQALASRLRHADRQISTLALLNISGRVSRTLLELAIMSNGQRVVGDPFTQKDLAGMIGASREMVNRTLRDLMDQGYISIGRKSITILNDKLPESM
jgi:CRP/FNR family cyclic AMP-dependent transcriptional regulator